MKKIFAKLNAMARRENGFTLAELLVAMLVFGIVVAIAVPLFINQREANRVNEIKADLLNASISIEAEKTENGGLFPESKPESISLQTASADNLVYTYPYDRMAYCLQIIVDDKTFFKSSKSTEVSTTDCTYEYLVPSTKLVGVMDGFKPVLSWKTVAAASEYVIYKNNIPVENVSIPAGSGQKSASYTLANMAPEEQAIFYIIVRDGNTASAQSNSVTLTAPVPPPTEPTIKIAATEAHSSTEQQYTIQWSAIRYASGYEVWDVTGTPALIATLGRYDTSYKFINERGTANKVAVKATNDEGTSPSSNTLLLETVWPEAKIISATSDPNTGKISFVFQEEEGGKRVPDWGTPDHKVTLKIVQTDTGAVVFNQPNLTAATYIPNKTFNRVTHTATITVTTSTGVVLGESAPVTIEFPPPSAPIAVKNFASDDKGVASLSPNRAIWDAVICENATPEYYLTKGTLNSGWITGTNYEYPASWLVQGSETTIGIVARCKNGNGISPESPRTTQSFTVGLMAPDAPKNFTAVNDGSEVKWDAAVCASGTKVEYRIFQSEKNSAPVDNYIDLKTTKYTLPDLFPGLRQTATVQARCVQYATNGTTVKAASSWSQFAPAYEWETPLPKPDAPVIRLVKKSYSSPTEVTYNIAWNEVAYAQSFSVYNVNDMDVPLLTVGSGANATSVTLTRGTTEEIIVIAKNKNASSNNSNILVLNDEWAKPAILDVETYPYEGTIYLRWQDGTDEAPTPDWGAPMSVVDVDVQNDETKEIHQYKNIQGREYVTPEELVRDDYTLQIHVTTSTGVRLSSPKVKASFPPPGPPAPVEGFTANSDGTGAIKHNRLQWTEVNCAASDAEYLITNTDGSGNSGWISGIEASPERYFDIPQEWLRQGFTEDFTIVARCVNPAGESDPSEERDTQFNATVLDLAPVTGVKNNGIDLVSWDHSTCPVGLSRQYNVVSEMLNDQPQVVSYDTENNSFILPDLEPWTNQKVFVQVRCFNPANNVSSNWSVQNAGNTTSWRTPMPVPNAPVIKLDGSRVANATQQEYTISWPAVEWAEGYEAYVGNERVFTTNNGSATSAKILRNRGTSSDVVLRATNRAGTSPDSNKVRLSNTWPTPVILTNTGSQDGRISYTWQTGTGTALTPDWGTPGYKVSITVSAASNMANPIYTANDITSTGHTTTVIAPTPADRMDKTYYAQIKVTTSTGTVLTSAIKSMKFDRPAVVDPNPPTGFNSNAAGPGPKKNDRLVWDAVTCPTATSTPKYQIYKITPGTTTIISGRGQGNITTNYFNIPQAWITEGEDTKWRLTVRCEFSNGDYSPWSTFIYHDFTVGLVAPQAPTNLRRDDVTTNTVQWNGVTCGAGTTPEYQIVKTIHNGASANFTSNTNDTVYDLMNVTDGTDQRLAVKARCVLTRDDSVVSAWSDLSNTLNYRSPLPNPAAPVVKVGATTVVSSKVSRIGISWNAIEYSEYYDIYNAATGALIRTVPATATNTTVDVNRGSTGTVRVYVKSRNFTYTGPQSNIVALSAPWPAAAVLTTSTNQDKQVTVKWQNSPTSPDWGNPDDRVVVVAKQNGTIVYTSPAQTGESMTTAALPAAVDTQIFIRVTTANGEVLTSPEVTAKFIQPAVPAQVTNVQVVNGTGPINPSKITWTGVTCSVPGTTPEYFVRQFAVGSTTTNKINTNWTLTATEYSIPQSWLTQGDIYTYGVYSRCVSGNGSSADGGVVRATANRTNVLTPAAPANFRVTANNDNGTATIAWNAVTCPTGFTANYQPYFTKRNGAASTATAATASTNTTANLTGLTQGTDHSANVAVRCVKGNETSVASAWSARSNTVAWTTPIPIAAAPVIKLTQASDNAAAGTVTYNITWPAVAWADKYIMYDAVTGTKLYEGTAVTRAATVKKHSDQSFYVVAVNSRGTSPKSNTVKASPRFATPAISKFELDHFTMSAAWWFQNVTGTWGTGATAKMVSGTYASDTVTGASSHRRTHDRTDRNWYLEVTTIHGNVLKSANVLIDTNPTPTLKVTHDLNYQSLKYAVTGNLTNYGLTSSTGKWDIQVSNTTSFAKTYPQSNKTGTNNITASESIHPTHGGTYYVRYVITRNEDGRTLTTPTQTISLPTRALDVKNDGTRDVIVVDTAAGTNSKTTIVPTWPNDGGGGMNVGAAYTDSRVVGIQGRILPILDFTRPGSQGYLYWLVDKDGSLQYYEFNNNGTVAAPKQVGVGWNLYEEVAVVQNFWGNDLPGMIGFRAAGTLDFWKLPGNGTITNAPDSERQKGSGWGKHQAQRLSQFIPVYDWNGYGQAGIVALGNTSPWHWYYGARKDPSKTGAENMMGGVSLLNTWDGILAGLPEGNRVNWPRTGAPNACCSWIHGRIYTSVIRNGRVAPVVGLGPQSYLDVAVGRGTGVYNGLGINWGYSANGYIKYSGQGAGLAN